VFPGAFAWNAIHRMSRLPRYLHTERLFSALSEEELAYLLGAANASTISRFETGMRTPSLKAAFACQVLFDTPPSNLLPKLYRQVEEEVVRRAYVLHQRIQGEPSAGTRAKLDFLEAVQKRATDRAKKRRRA
jgi:transcriptional regulator with XRE-family HTH domain